MTLYDPTADPALILLSGKRDIEKRIAAAESAIIDAQELREREEAAQAYAGENEQHFASYLQDCIDQSVNANKAIREAQAHCYRVYLEDEPVNYAKKDAWQSRIIVPKPFGTVQYGASAIKRAFTPKFLSVSNAKKQAAGEFWKKVLDRQLNENHAKFVLRFTDATTMALAIGISMEMIPQWIPGLGLTFSLVEPWKIHRDPDAASRDPQSGLYWIHQEWLDWHVLKEGEKTGKYQNVNRVRESETAMPNNPWMSQEAIAARKKMIWERSAFRPMVLTSEFWGAVLSPKGEMLLPNARFTVAAGRVVQLPKATPYRTLRWPGIAFSPMPDLLKFNGRGLLEGILSLWEAMCNLMCLHMDNLQWLVNPMTEIGVDNLVDPSDTETWPGKSYLVHDTVNGQPVVREVLRRGKTNEVLANMQNMDQHFQRGTFVTDAVQGLPGYRKDMTYREAAMNLDQSLGVYSLMGESIEAGAIDAIAAAAEFIAEYASYRDYREIFSDEELQAMGIAPDPDAKNGVSGVPPIDGSFHVSGIQALMKENEALTNIKNVVIPLATNPRFARYIKPYQALRAIEVRTNLADENLFVSEQEAMQIEAQEYAALAAQKQAMDEAQDIQQANALADLANKMTPAGSATPTNPPQGAEQ
ncbi:MAG: hypothetical protein A4E74_01549 [Syntrophus sp. PtaB.Bin075]|nr:MAG: hypothetical protein A4E74_01549 [Syntrophus sp. PtaB.Bin075]